MNFDNTNRSDSNDYDGNSCLCGCDKEFIQTNKY